MTDTITIRPKPMKEKTLFENNIGELFYFCNGHYWKADVVEGGVRAGWIPIDLDVIEDDITPTNPPTICKHCGNIDLVLRGLGVNCEVVYICTKCRKINYAGQSEV